MAISSTSSSSTSRIEQNFVPESDSDSEDFESFEKPLRKLDTMRMPYSAREDVEILKFVLKNDNVERVGSLSLWKELEGKKGEPKRTYQSLKNRFLRNIKPHLLTKYGAYLNEDCIKKMKRKFPDLERAKEARQTIKKITFRTNSTCEEKQTKHVKYTEVGNEVLGRETWKIGDVEVNTPTVTELFNVKNKKGNDEINNQKRSVDLREEMKDGDVDNREKEIVPLNGSENVSLSGVEVSIPKNNKCAPPRSFQYSKIIESLKNGANLKLNIALKNDSEFLKNSIGPILINVVVTVTPVQEDGVTERNERTFRQKQNCTMNSNFFRKNVKKAPKNQPIRGRYRYVLTLKKNIRRQLSQRLYSQALEVIYEIKKKNGPREREFGLETEKTLDKLLRNNTPEATFNPSMDRSSLSSSDETNCSTSDDESEYSEVYKEFCKNFEIIMEDDMTDDNEEEEDEYPWKRQEKNEDPCTSSTLLKNMAGMLSPKSNVFGSKSRIGKNISDKL